MIFIPGFSDVMFQQVGTQRQYRKYVLRFLTEIFGSTKLTLRKIKRIIWVQVMRNYQRHYKNNQSGAKNMKYALKRYFSSLGKFQNGEFKQLTYEKKKGFKKEVLT